MSDPDGGEARGDAPTTRSAPELARAFDEAFTAPPRREWAGDRQRMLAFRSGRNLYALRLAEVDTIATDRSVTPLPARVPGLGLLGLAGVRSMPVPVYDLGVVLGEPRIETPKWIAFAGRAEPIGLAFERLVGLVDVAGAALAPVEGIDHIHRRFEHDREVCAVVEVGSVCARIAARARSARRTGRR